MTTKTEGNILSDIVLWEAGAEVRFCREKVTLETAVITADYDIGTVLEASSTKYVKCTTGSSAAAILLEKVTIADLAAGDVSAVALVRGPAVVKKNELKIAAAQLDAAATALKAITGCILAQV